MLWEEVVNEIVCINKMAEENGAKIHNRNAYKSYYYLRYKLKCSFILDLSGITHVK